MNYNKLVLIATLILCTLLWTNDGVACQNSCGVCHVDCSDNVHRACKRTHSTITKDTLELTMQVYRSSNNSLTKFRQLLNQTYTGFFMDKYNNCTHPSYEVEEDKANNIYNPRFLLYFIIAVISLHISI